MKRQKMSRPKSRSDFKRKAGSHPKNTRTPPVQRGGYRL
ncbi:MAG: hypothetical protein [Microvirus sp.]|nr:MAG: hypothetical protein [Microvirus sp.]